MFGSYVRRAGDWWTYTLKYKEIGGKEMMLLLLRNGYIKLWVQLRLWLYGLPAVLIRVRRGFHRLLYPEHSAEMVRIG